MKKATGLLLIATFLFLFFIVAAILVTLAIYLAQGTTPSLLGGQRLALVRIVGPIYYEEDWVNEIESYQDDSSIKGIVIEVDSPGGAVGPSQNLYKVIRDTRVEHGKVVVAYFNSIAASGGYYVACEADRIVSTPGAMTGSIGVYAKFMQAEEMLAKIGLDYETVKAGKFKDMGSFDRPLTDDERDLMQAVIDDTYMQFIESVAAGRGAQVSTLLDEWSYETHGDEFPFTEDVVDIIQTYQSERDRYLERQRNDIVESATGEESENSGTLEYKPSPETILSFVQATAQGKIYTGRQALKVGLVDQLGSIDDAIDLAARLAGIRGEPTVVEKIEPEMTLLDLLTSQASSMLGLNQSPSPVQMRFP